MSGRLAYARECQLLRAAAELLRLPQPVIATSLTFLHRYHRACPDTGSQPQIVPACLFLASKVEEAQVRINDLLNAFLYLDKIADPAAVAAIFPGLAVAASTPDDCAAALTASPTEAAAAAEQSFRPAADTAAGSRTVAARLHAPPAASTADTGQQHKSPAVGAASRAADPPADHLRPSLLVGDAYYAAKDELIHHEQVLLRWLGFQICIDHPFRYLLNFANVMRCGSPVVRLSLSLVNDSLLHTDLSVRARPADVAAGALQLAALLLGAPLLGASAHSSSGSASSDGASWCQLVGLDPADAGAAGRELLEAVSDAAAAAGDGIA